MSRTPAKFTQADIARALRAVAQCEANMEIVLEPDGRIRLVPATGEKPGPQVDTGDSICL
jgi:hypothetical protein